MTTWPLSCINDIKREANEACGWTVQDATVLTVHQWIERVYTATPPGAWRELKRRLEVARWLERGR